MDRLSRHTYRVGLDWLSAREPRLGAIRMGFGDPPFWSREPGFPSLVHIVLEQQVSLASARAAYERLLMAVDQLTPATFMEFGADELKSMGFSRQKMATCRRIAQGMLDDELDLAKLERLEDELVKNELVRIKGVGSWTAEIYLLMALGRPDVFPSGDLALATAVQKLLSLPDKPCPKELDQRASHWKPWRSVAARLLWHYYLSSKGRNLPGQDKAEG